MPPNPLAASGLTAKSGVQREQPDARAGVAVSPMAPSPCTNPAVGALVQSRLTEFQLTEDLHRNLRAAKEKPHTHTHT